MANEILRRVGSVKQICFADHAGDFNPAAGTSLEQGTPHDVEIELVGVVTTEARESNKVDLGNGSNIWAVQYSVMAAFEFAVAPASGATVELHWAPSPDSVAGNGNPGGITGVDADYTGTANDSLADSVKQLDFIGVFTCTSDATATVQVAKVAVFSPSDRYGTLVVYSKAGQAFHSDDVECHVVFTPIADEGQA